MHFPSTTEQQMLRDSVARYGRDFYEFDAWHKSVAGGNSFDRIGWRRMADLGWLGICVPESADGMGGTMSDVMAVMEGFGRSLMLEPYVTTCVLGVQLLRNAENPLATQLLSAVASGDMLLSVGLSEPAARFDLAHVETTGVREDRDFLLSGTKEFVLDGDCADWLVVPARTSGAVNDEQGITLFLVERDAQGLEFEHSRGPDHRGASRVCLQNVRVDATKVIGEVGQGFPILDRAVDHAILARLGEALGVMDAARDITLEYLKTREQFGKKIGSFQVLQHRMVDMAIACEEARSITYAALDAIDAEQSVRRRAVSAAKARVGQTSLFVGHQAVQLHGGIGTSDELIVSHYLKRLAMIEISFGNSSYHLKRFADTPRVAVNA